MGLQKKSAKKLLKSQEAIAHVNCRLLPKQGDATEDILEAVRVYNVKNERVRSFLGLSLSERKYSPAQKGKAALAIFPLNTTLAGNVIRLSFV
jgi:uncharacterized membrane protein